MDELLSEFLTETTESLSTLDVELVRLERNPDNPELLQNIFRLVHTIKGTCGFLGLPRLEKVAHAAENVLGKVRDRELTVTPYIVTLILESLDQIKEILAELERTQAEPAGNDADLIGRLDAAAEGVEAPAKTAAPTGADGAPDFEAVRRMMAAEISGNALPDDEDETEAEAPAGLPVGTAQPQALVAAAAGAVATQQAPAAAEAAPRADAGDHHDAGSNGGPRESHIAGQTIRVNVDLLEHLMTMVSELVLTRNQLLQMVRGRSDSEFTVPLQRLSHVTSELQEGVMKTRMQPIGNAWAKLPRIVRDLGQELNKKLDLKMYGSETELDRQVLELIKDPLTHMVRNSADHGLERPDERRAAGKPETGTITLNAYHEGGHIIIEIADDGRGIDLTKVRQKIVKVGLATENELDGMTDTQIAQYIFRPGFSTAEKVTSVSGRGVGMDVVRTNIEKIGGTIELRTVSGKGSTFVIKIPLTLAIVAALIVEAAGDRFALPQISVVELVRASNTSEHRIERINSRPVLRLRDHLLPLVSLGHALALVDEHDPQVEIDDDGLFVIVCKVGTFSFGIIVDQVFDTEEIVVKPVAPILRDITMFSGNTILGDGSVVMILDPNGLATSVGEIQTASDRRAEAAAAEAAANADDKLSLLVFRAGGEDPKAVPLSLVARLEEIDLATVERSDGRPVVQYRGQIMPLVMVNEGQELAREGRQPVVVFTERNRTMGLVVDEIVDIVEDSFNVELRSRRDGLIGTAVIAGRTTDIVDVGYYLLRATGDWYEAEPRRIGAARARRVLLVDDSAFFRSLIAPVLRVSGYEVSGVESAEAALKLRDQGAEFDIIVSDIEMPGMDGFAFARTIREEGAWSQVPMIALSSHTAPEDFDRGRDSGYDDYVAKFDREGLIAAIGQVMNMAKGSVA
ncbi:chemotaxis protein CheW [Tistrella mobilis]|uniref:Chemotaxis protein CheA n=1 Tax=Tistrella mobilis TaxID=171437 RepID=A0A162L9R2_9PROT|nr:chemotaxis protein CheW [Tistrella mobilis]KYO54025.1 ATPase [Tistrella mobilis]